KQTISPHHIIASCALPPGFPAVRIDNEYYWDGGVLSNTPVQALTLMSEAPANTLCFMANLFDSYGLNPKSLDDVFKCHKDIMYSSQDRMHLQSLTEILQLRRKLQYMYSRMPPSLRKDSKIQEIHSTQCSDVVMHFVRFLYTAPHTELSSKDF